MRLGYNTNGMAHHRLSDALALIADIGYRSVGLTLDHQHLDPYAKDSARQVGEIGAMCRDLDLQPVIETGARFVLDPRRKHRPTLLESSAAERALRADFIARAIDIAAALGASVVSLWSGVAPVGTSVDDRLLYDRLASELSTLSQRAADAGVVLGFEPEPGMLVQDMAEFDRLRALVDHSAFGLTLDIGHAHITEAAGAAATVRAYAEQVVNVHIEGMRHERHDHLEPHQGDMDVRAVVGELVNYGYSGPATLELSRHSHNAVVVAKRAFEFLTSEAYLG